MGVKYIQPISAGSAEGLVAEVYSQIKQEFGSLVEPFTLHSPIPNLLAGAWMAARESQLVGRVRRDLKEAVAAVVSTINHCPYCIDAHTITLKAIGKHKASQAITNGEIDQISDSKMYSMIRWASATRSPGSEPLLSPPFSREEEPEVIGTAVFYHYINRMVTILLTETPLPSNRSWLKRPLKKLASLLFSEAVRRTIPRGESLRFLPEADLPPDLSWSKQVPTIAQAFACLASTIDSVGIRTLSPEVCKLIQEQVRTWKGEDPGLSRGWTEHKIRGLGEASQAAGRLTLLTALAPHQVDDETILNFQTYFPEDEELLGALAWASFTAARKIGTWLQQPFSEDWESAHENS